MGAQAVLNGPHACCRCLWFVQDSGLNAYTNAFYMTITILGGVPYGNMALHGNLERGFTMILICFGFKLLFAWVYRSPQPPMPLWGERPATRDPPAVQLRALAVCCRSRWAR